MKKEQNSNQTPWWQPGLILFTKLSAWIAGPIVSALFLGRWLDRRYGTEPWLFLLCVGAAFTVSLVAITYHASKDMKRIEDEAKKKKETIIKKQ